MPSLYTIFPFCISITPRDALDTGEDSDGIAQTLLLYEQKLDSQRRNKANSGSAAKKNPSTAPIISKQWNLVRRTYKNPVLILGALYYHGDLLLRLLRVAQPQDINLRGANAWTALHFAAGTGNITVVRGLINEFGTDVDPESSEGRTPAFIAKSNGFGEALGFLKERGAGVEVADDEKMVYKDGILDAVFERRDGA